MAAKQKRFNLILCAQGSALTIYDRLLPPLKQLLPLRRLGLYVADQVYFDRYLAGPNNFSAGAITWLKEWEINRLAAHVKPDPAQLKRQEELYGQPNLWPALIADRRVFLGPLAKYKQDYSPRLSHEQMLSRLQTAIEQIEQFIAQVKPDAIIGFNMVTLDEFIFYLIARRKSIPYWQIKNAKINNLLTLFPDPLQLSAYLARSSPPHFPPATLNQASQYLARAQAKNSVYEGHVVLTPPSLRSLLTPAVLTKLAHAAVFSLLKPARFPHDAQSAGFTAVWQHNLNRPIKAIQHHRWLSQHYLSPSALPHTPYIFFPLHTEPEIALSIYGRYHLNQIEVIRNLAQSIPVTWSVVVKDHPRSLGLRQLSYYQKLLRIPNVKLVNPYLPSYDVIDHAQAIVTISSWVGFEAVMSKKPVVTLGECTYNCLPDSMVLKNRSYYQLAADLERALHHYHYDEAALLNHIATVISLSFPINLYSDILAKPNRHPGSPATLSPARLWSDFARYIVSTITTHDHLSAPQNQTYRRFI